MEEQARAAPMTCLEGACIIAAVLLYPLSVVSIRELMIEPSNVGSSAVGGISEILLWLALVVFVYAASARAPSTPLIHAARGLIAIGGALASCWAVMVPFNPLWVWTTPLLMPPLAMLFAFWSTQSAGKPARTRNLIALGFAVISAPLVAAPFVKSALEYPEAARYAREEALEQERRDAAAEAEYEARYRALSAQSRLEEFLAFTQPDNPRRQRALAIARTIPTRHQDAIRVVDESEYYLPAEQLWEFDINVTPELCRSYRLRLLEDLNRWPADQVPTGFTLQYRNIEWLYRSGCDLSAEMRRLIVAGRSDRAERRDRDFAGQLEALLAR